MLTAILVGANQALVVPSTSTRLIHANGASLRAPLMVAAEPSATVPGTRGGGDDDAFRNDPAGFCSERARQHGGVFVTGVADGTVFVGEAAALSSLDSSRTSAESSAAASAGSDGSELAAPFARADGGSEAFTPYAEKFNKACYDSIFLWIPRYKEAGFSTFRFEDFIDGRVRRLVPSIRTMVLKGSAPALFGVETYDELPAALGFENGKALEAAYAAHAPKLRGPAKFGLPSFPSLFDLESGGGDPKALEAGLAQWGRAQQQSGGGGGGLLGASAAAGASSGTSLLWELSSSVEQVTALCATMLIVAHSNRGLHSQCCKALVAEQAAVLKGAAPDCTITTEILGRMPELDAFANECLRLYPPSRPGKLRLSAPLSLGEGMELPAGTQVAAEPFVASTTCDNAAAFDPSRHLASASASAASPLVPFGTAVPGAPAASAPLRYGGAADETASGASIAVAMAKVFYVQVSRMFEEVLIGAEPAPNPSGAPAVHMAPEKVEVLLKPKMFYELQRGVKKLRF